MIGSYNGITSTSLVLTDKENVDSITTLSIGKVDEYSATELRAELIHLKNALTSNKCLEYAQVKSGASQLESVYNALGSLLRSRLPKSDSDEESTNFFGDDSVDLFGDIEDSLEVPQVNLLSASIDELINLGENSVDISEQLRFQFQEELAEFGGSIRFFELRLKDSNRPIREVARELGVKEGDRIWSKKELFLSSLITDSESMYDFSIKELNRIKELIESIASDVVEEHEKLSPEAEQVLKVIYKHAMEKIEVNGESMLYIDYLIRTISMRCAKVDSSRLSVFNIPINQLHYRMKGKSLVALVEMINEKYDSALDKKTVAESVRKNLSVAESYVRRMSSYKEFLKESNRVEINQIADEIISMIKSRTPTSMVDRYPGMREFIISLYNRNLIKINQSKLSSKEFKTGKEVVKIYLRYKLYGMKDLFSLEHYNKLFGLELSYNQFIAIFRELYSALGIIPATTKELFVETVLANSGVMYATDNSVYEEVLPNIAYIDNDMDSKLTILDVQEDNTVVELIVN